MINVRLQTLLFMTRQQLSMADFRESARRDPWKTAFQGLSFNMSELFRDLYSHLQLILPSTHSFLLFFYSGQIYTMTWRPSFFTHLLPIKKDLFQEICGMPTYYGKNVIKKPDLMHSLCFQEWWISSSFVSLRLIFMSQKMLLGIERNSDRCEWATWRHSCNNNAKLRYFAICSEGDFQHILKDYYLI